MLKTRWTARWTAPIFIISLLLVGIFLFTLQSFTSASQDSHTVGYVDIQAIFEVHPHRDKAEATLEERAIEMQIELEELAQDKDEEEQEELLRAYQRELEEYEQELIANVVEDIQDTISQVAQKEGVSLVLEASHVIYGGFNLTPLVLEYLDL